MSDILVPKTLLRNPARFGGAEEGDLLRGAPVIRAGRLAGLDAPAGGDASIVIPALTEAHCHLDKCHTFHRLGPIGGDLRQAIAAQREDKAHWTEDDLRTRATRGLNEAREAGCRTLRTHVDWGDDVSAPTGWRVMTELAQDTDITLQTAALIGIEQMTDSGFATSAAKTIAETNGVLGAFILGHGRTEAGLAKCFDLADRHGLALDFHVDEGLGAFDGVEAIPDAALVTGFQGPVLCGHAVALMDKSDGDFKRIADKLAAANIAICALPTTNLYLQGRVDGTPDRRGITRLQELHAAGVRIVIGSDNVGDAFCPTGAHDPRQALYLATLTAHLDPPLGRWLPSITTDARTALGLAPDFIEDTPLSALRACAVPTLADLIAGRAPLTAFNTEETK